MPHVPPPTAIEDLLRERTWIRTLARAMVSEPSAAADVEQEAWLTALRRPPGPGPRLKGWLRHVVRSRAVDGFRAGTRRQQRELAAGRGGTAPAPDTLLEQVEMQGAVARGVAALAEPYRLTVLLRYFEGLSSREIAESLDVPLATVRSRLQRAHGMLRTRLKNRLGNEGSGWHRGLLLLGGDPGPSIAQAASAALKGGLAMTATQKLFAASAAILLAIGGGLVGAWVLQPDADTPNLDTPPLRAADGPSRSEPAPVLRGVSQDPAGSSTAAVAALRSEVAALRAELKVTQDKLSGFDPALFERIAKAMPHLLAEIMRRNGSYAFAALRNFTSAHAQIQATGRIDTDNDGTGEYGGFREMSGAVPGRMDAAMVPPVLSSKFRTLNDHGEAKVSGYLFRFYLPNARGEGVGEPKEGFSRDGRIDADLAETTWCCYAWPAQHGVTGTRTLFMNQGGDMLWTDDARYSGSGKGPKPDAAFRAAQRLSGQGIVGQVAMGETGQDGNTWRR